MRTARSLVMLVLVASGVSGCADSTNTTTSESGTTTLQASSATSNTTARQTYRHLRDGSTFTQDDSDRDLAISHGDGAELRLSADYVWTNPQIAGPGDLVPLTTPDEVDYVAWELTTSGPGNLNISVTGVPDCGDDDCNQDDLTIAFSIVVRQP